ncbi:MAG: DUF4256 domain-containing protein [Bacteroidales bacterium]
MTDSDHAAELSEPEHHQLLKTLQARFEKNMHRHKDLVWEEVLNRLQAHPGTLVSLQKMEETGGEPDVVGQDDNTGELIFFDCAKESPKGRRSFCYDQEGLLSRKDYPPANSAIEMAREMGIELLTEEQYRYLQQLGPFDTKTSSWLTTPPDIREKGGALFGDYRYGQVFVYHNGAQSYYAVRGFRGVLKV